MFVADRENNRTVLLSAETGKMLGEWACPALGHAGKAWGVRASFHRDDLIFLVSCQISLPSGLHYFSWQRYRC